MAPAQAFILKANGCQGCWSPIWGRTHLAKYVPGDENIFFQKMDLSLRFFINAAALESIYGW
jgi:hypothetical protein